MSDINRLQGSETSNSSSSTTSDSLLLEIDLSVEKKPGSFIEQHKSISIFRSFYAFSLHIIVYIRYI